MSSWNRTLVGVAIILVFVAGCGSEGVQTTEGTSTTSVTPTTAPFEGTVFLKDFSALCSEGQCWLPTQWTPKLVAGETVSLRDQWPMDGMQVEVVCQTTGESYRDQTGQSRDDWYGIKVPNDKLEPLSPGNGPKALPKDDGWIGYVGAAWIKHGTDKRAPAC